MKRHPAIVIGKLLPAVTLLLPWAATGAGAAPPDVTAPPGATAATGPSTPSNELPYAELMKQAEARMVPGPNNTITATNANTAVALFNRAAAVGKDDNEKFTALFRAGQTQERLKQYAQAQTTYFQAFSLKKISDAQKARAKFGLGSAQFSKLKAENHLGDAANADMTANFEAAMISKDLPVDERRRALEMLAETAGVSGKPAVSAMRCTQLLSLPGITKQQQIGYLDRAIAEIKKAPPGDDSIKIANKLFAQQIATGTPDQVHGLKVMWGEVLLTLKDEDGALSKWGEVANDNQAGLDKRALALRDISHLQAQQKNYEAAIQAADRLSGLPGATPQVLAWKAWDRAAVFVQQHQEEKARIEWKTLTDAPQTVTQNKAAAWAEIAASYGREIKALPADAPKAKKDELLAAQKTALETIWHTDSIPWRPRTQAILQRAQLDLEAKDNASAATLLNNAVADVDKWTGNPDDRNGSKREIYIALAAIYRFDKEYGKALAALLLVQGNSGPGDATAAQTALQISGEAFAAKQWDDCRVILLALQNVWGLPHKTYLINKAQVEVSAQKWADAKVALDEVDTLTPNAEEKKSADELRAKIPAAT